MQWVETAAHPFTHPFIASADLARACLPSPLPMGKRSRKRTDVRVWGPGFGLQPVEAGDQHLPCVPAPTMRARMLYVAMYVHV
jgi:hypothetical protein